MFYFNKSLAAEEAIGIVDKNVEKAIKIQFSEKRAGLRVSRPASVFSSAHQWSLHNLRKSLNLSGYQMSVT